MSLQTLSNTDAKTTGASPNVSSIVTQEILRAIEELRFGSVEIVVHDAKVVQIEWKEKIRF